jgi:hypothetical protein
LTTALLSVSMKILIFLTLKSLHSSFIPKNSKNR